MSMLAPADRLGEDAPAEVVAAVAEFAMRLAAEGRLRDGRQLRDGGSGSSPPRRPGGPSTGRSPRPRS
ncbi:MAG: hypothetical protein K0S88_2048 [Actinomycetia bacterium]|nr:hypothetical protein [Actinomycetes bacterium]